MLKRILLFILFITTFFPSLLADDINEARKVFDYTYNMVFGPQGSTLRYDVNIIGIKKINGTIWYKGKKSKFMEERHISWNDGVKDYWLDRKKKTVTLYDANSEKKDKYSSKFKFNANDYNYSLETTRERYVVSLTARKNVKGIKQMKATIDRKTRAPLNLKIKVLWFWTTVNISNFRSGNINDDVFVFPSSQYGSYPLIDRRGE